MLARPKCVPRDFYHSLANLNVHSKSTYTFLSSSITRDRTVYEPERASIPEGASSVTKRLVTGSGEGPYEPIIDSSLSTVRVQFRHV